MSGFWIGLIIFGALLLAASLSPASRPRQRTRFYSDALLGVTWIAVGAANLWAPAGPIRAAVSAVGILAALGALGYALATLLRREDLRQEDLRREDLSRLARNEAAAASDVRPWQRHNRTGRGIRKPFQRKES